MLNRKYFPFERNSYYFGKLLTAKNFEAEQKYHNDKRRLINRLTSGGGILAGLGVIRADDSSLVVQAGCAVDAGGREIVVPETRVVKLSTIEGFGQLSSACALLGIAYDEQPADEALSIMGEAGQEPCYNTTRETYRLTLLDEELAARVPAPEEEFVSRLVVYSDRDVELVQYTPKFVPLGGDVCVQVEFCKVGPGTGAYSFCYDLEAPGFGCGESSNTIPVVANGLVLSQGERRRFSYRLTPQQHIWGGNSNVSATVLNFTMQRGDESFHLNETLQVQLRPVRESLDEHVLSAWYGKAMDKALEEGYDRKLWIARVHLLRQGSTVIIDRIEPPPFGQFSYNAQQLMLLRRLEAFYPGAGTGTAPVPAAEAQPGQTAAAPQAGAELGRYTASGTFDLPLGLGYDTRQAVFSDEIMHGLGQGPVCVQVGIEYITGGPKDVQASEILLGDASIFGQEERPGGEERIYSATTAVKVLPERGTFVVGARLGEASGLISLRIRWFAFRVNELNKQLKLGHEGERYILVNPDTIVLPPKGTAHISPVFINMPAEACSYRVVDAEGGSIDNNGVYTAPAKEGVYEIRIEAVSDPTVYVHAFAIVTQKKKDEVR